MYAKLAEKLQPSGYVHNVIGKAEAFYVKNVLRPMSVGRRCNYAFVILREWESAGMMGAEIIRINLWLIWNFHA